MPAETGKEEGGAGTQCILAGYLPACLCPPPQVPCQLHVPTCPQLEGRKTGTNLPACLPTTTCSFYPTAYPPCYYLLPSPFHCTGGGDLPHTFACAPPILPDRQQFWTGYLPVTSALGQFLFYSFCLPGWMEPFIITLIPSHATPPTLCLPAYACIIMPLPTATHRHCVLFCRGL